jgi:PKD repeat protein
MGFLFISVMILILVFLVEVEGNETGITTLDEPLISQDGCSCHEEIQPSVILTLDGLPEEYEPFQTYRLILDVSGGPSEYSGGSNAKGGFNLNASAGSLAIPGGSTDVQVEPISGEATHSEIGNDQRSWVIDWTAPSNEDVTFNFLGNSVDGNGDEFNDMWNRFTTTVIVSEPPVAEAGDPRKVETGALMIFDGGGSTDNSGEIANYTWTFTEDTTEITLFGVSPEHTFENPGDHIVTLTVLDGAGNQGMDTVTIEVVLDLTPPVAHAGSHQSVIQGTEVELDGSATSDNSGFIAEYSWSFAYDGSPVDIFGERPSFTFDIVGNYMITLTVADGAENLDTDYVWVNVTADLSAPIASAGPDLTGFRNSFVIIEGLDSIDNVGVRSWIWTFYDGIDDRTFHGSTLVHTFSINGNYEITLNVSDIAGNWDTDKIQITIVTDDVKPVADAGIDLIVNQDKSVVFNGLASYDNVDILEYSWDMDDGDGVNWSDPDYFGSDLWNPIHIFTRTGIFNVTLRVEDEAGNWDTDTIKITVVDVADIITSSRIQGKVKDRSGEPVPGASVRIENTGVIYMTETNSKGAYSVPRVPWGSYRLVISARGFESNETDINVSGEEVMSLAAITLEPETADGQSFESLLFPFAFVFIILIIFGMIGMGGKGGKGGKPIPYGEKVPDTNSKPDGASEPEEISTSQKVDPKLTGKGVAQPAIKPSPQQSPDKTPPGEKGLPPPSD